MYDDVPIKNKLRQKRRKMKAAKVRSKYAKELEAGKYKQKIIQDKRDKETWDWMDEALEEYYNGPQNVDKEQDSEKVKATISSADVRTEHSGDTTRTVVEIHQDEGERKE